MKRMFLSVIITVALWGSIELAHAQVTIIVNKTVNVTQLDRETVERIFLGKKSQWSDGTKVIPAVLKSGNVHKQFVKKYLDRDASQFSTYWKQAIFTGRGVPPKSFETEAELIDFVSETPGAIGYVSSAPQSKLFHLLEVK